MEFLTTNMTFVYFCIVFEMNEFVVLLKTIRICINLVAG